MDPIYNLSNNTAYTTSAPQAIIGVAPATILADPNGQPSFSSGTIYVDQPPTQQPTFVAQSPIQQPTIIAPVPLNPSRLSLPRSLSPHASAFRPIAPAAVDSTPVAYPAAVDTTPVAYPAIVNAPPAANYPPPSAWSNTYPSGTVFISPPVPSEPLPSQPISSQPTLSQPVLSQPVVYQSTPYQSTPYQSTPYQSTPYQSAPYQSAPQTTSYQPTLSQPISSEPIYQPATPSQPVVNLIPAHIANPKIPLYTTPPGDGFLTPHPTIPPASPPSTGVPTTAMNSNSRPTTPTNVFSTAPVVSTSRPSTPTNAIPRSTTPANTSSRSTTPTIPYSIIPTTPRPTTPTSVTTPRSTTPPMASADQVPRPNMPPTSPGSYASVFMNPQNLATPGTSATTMESLAITTSAPGTPSPIPPSTTTPPPAIPLSPTIASDTTPPSVQPVRSTFQRFPFSTDTTPQIAVDQVAVNITSLQGEAGICEACNVEPYHTDTTLPPCGHKICEKCKLRPTCLVCEHAARMATSPPTDISNSIPATTATVTPLPTSESIDSLANSTSSVGQPSIRTDAVAGPSSQSGAKARTPSPILQATALSRGKMLVEKWKICYLCGKNPKNMLANCGHCMCRECMMNSAECKFCHTPITKGQTIVM